MVSNSMDPMSMEASLYVTSSAGSSVVPSRLHVSMRPYGGEPVDGWADPLLASSSLSVRGSLPRCEDVVGMVDSLVGGSLPTSFIRGSSFADLFKVVPIQVDYVSGPSILLKNGGYVAIRVDPSAYKSILEVCKFSLIGWVILLSGEKPWKLVDLKAKLQSVWKLNSVWRLISLGKGYFQIMLNSDADKNMVWSLGSLNLKSGVLRLQPWIPDFNPTLQKSSNVQVWVRFYNLSWEYLHPKIISDLTRGIGVPLRLDRATIEGDFGHFAPVLVDIDVSIMPPSSLLLEMDDSHSSFISVEYENLLTFCSTCSSIDHFPSTCRWNKSGKGILDLWSLDSDVVHSSAGLSVHAGGRGDDSLTDVLVASLDPIVSAIFSDSVSLTVSREQHSGSVNAITISSSVAGSTQSSGLPASNSQAELRLIVGSSWASQTKAEGLDASNISQRTTLITHRLMKLKSKMRTSSGVSDDYCPLLELSWSIIEDYDLIGVCSQCALFNWARGRYPYTRVERRLDRVLVSEGCISCWRDISCVALLRRFLDHCPLVIRLSDIENAVDERFVLTDDRSSIKDHIIEFYLNLFSSDSSRVETKFSVVEDMIPSLVTDVENAFLISIPSMDDINDAVFAMDAASASRLDSFSRGFYQRYWKVVVSDVVLAVQDFFRTWVIFSGLNSSFIVLLPKLKDSISIEQFHLIVLSNFLFKITSKILADRLAQIAARIVSPNQFGFIRDRHIEGCITLASDLLNVMHKKCYGVNLAMKIDISKAFDTLDWSFLRRVLHAFGFSPVFMNWIDNILGSSRLSVLINRFPKGYFHCSRGVRQGDPLSPLLFGIAEEFLSRLLSRMMDFSQLLPISSPRGFFTPTHLLYADDVLIFYRGTVRNLKNIMNAFEVYVTFQVSWLIGIGQLPFSYLGVPLFRGKPKKFVIQPIADKIMLKFAKWKGKALSLAGRATLIKLVITGSFVHSFMIYKWSFSLLRLVNRKLRNFYGRVLLDFWSDNWLGVPILELLRIPDYLASLLRARVSDFIHEGLLVERCLVPFYPSFSVNIDMASLLNRLPIEDRLCRAGFHLASRCSVCGVNSESSDHLFLRCPLAAALWEVVFSAFQRRISADSWSLFLSQAISFSFSDQICFDLVWRAVSDANRLEIGCMCNCVDDLLILRRLDLRGRSAKAPVIKSVIWSPPAPGWIKVNTNGATLSSPGVRGCGGVFRSCKAFVKGCFAVPLGQVFAFEEERLADSMAINLAC
ncbi:hypothetical protein Dsin_009052 [Dipteronia sinensis]|uniref:Reverse transcriptase domain-containing protein n=1 Tax=Dipteronia sinensis TaxID=43782 RepID=A0AAE0AR25_9ROSI|nr:hypothetical protein Dsin_009052 [Dipteronia sinensis]